MANEIRVTVTGDDELSATVEKAVDRSKGSLDELSASARENAAKMGRDFDGAFDGLGEGAGGAEQKFIGLKDSITGTQDVMSGLRNGDVLTLAQGMADLAGAAEALWASAGKLIVKLGQKAAAMAADTASTIANTAATVASTVASLAAEAASKAWAAAQWILNAALSANPIGLVVIAIVALVAAFVLAWQHSETFRNIVTGAFDAVMGVIQGVWHWVQDHWPLLLAILTGPIGLAVAFIIDNWNTVVGFITGLPGRIASAASGMWDGLKDAFRTAVNWIIDRWNGMSFGIPEIDTHIPGIGKVGGGSFRVPQIPRLARGGITNGPMLAVIGDNPGGRERITPLPATGSTFGGEGGVTIIVQALDARTAEEGVARAVAGARRRGLM